MPKLARYKAFIFLMFSADIFEGRKHLHVELRKGRHKLLAKFWLEPDTAH